MNPETIEALTALITAVASLLGIILTVMGPRLLNRWTKRAGIELADAEERYLLDQARVGVRWVEEKARERVREGGTMEGEEKRHRAIVATRNATARIIPKLDRDRAERAVLAVVNESRTIDDLTDCAPWDDCGEHEEETDEHNEVPR